VSCVYVYVCVCARARANWQTVYTRIIFCVCVCARAHERELADDITPYTVQIFSFFFLVELADGHITPYEMEFFYKEQLHRMDCLAQEVNMCYNIYIFNIYI
jgi:hypothetical protein